MHYIDNPIILTTSAQQVDASATFHRVVATIVMTGIASAGEVIKKQSKPVSSMGQQMRFDVAPTLRAYAAHFEYSPVISGGRLDIAAITVTVTFHDEYMISGRLATGAERNPVEGKSLLCSLGRYTDMERLRALLPGDVSRKPSTPVTPQLIAAPSTYVVPTPATQQQPRSSLGLNVVLSDDRRPMFGTEHTYVIPLSPDVAQFQFVNSRGMVETAHAFCFMKEERKGTSQTFIRSVPETLTTISRRLTIKGDDYPVLQMSSGYCSEEWARWWAYDFCRSNKHWLFVPDADIWVPCSIVLKDGYNIIDKSKAELPHIDFDVIPDINGPLL